jgi:hypothetical protein
MEAVLKRSDNDIVEAYWNMLSSLSRTVKLKLATMLTNAVLEEETATQLPHYRKAKVRRRAVKVPSDAELEARFADLEMPEYPQDDFTCKDIIDANSERTIKPIEKWL